MIYFGVLGFSYNDWVGNFYPVGMPKLQKLDSAAEKTFVFANNRWCGQAVSTIRQLRIMLN